MTVKEMIFRTYTLKLLLSKIFVFVLSGSKQVATNLYTTHIKVYYTNEKNQIYVKISPRQKILKECLSAFLNIFQFTYTCNENFKAARKRY